jgi:hypothetical protein
MAGRHSRRLIQRGRFPSECKHSVETGSSALHLASELVDGRSERAAPAFGRVILRQAAAFHVTDPRDDFTAARDVIAAPGAPAPLQPRQCLVVSEWFQSNRLTDLSKLDGPDQNESRLDAFPVERRERQPRPRGTTCFA